MEHEIRDEVKNHYGAIADQVLQQSRTSGCCAGSSCCGSREGKTDVGYTAENLSGLPQAAVTASLGCANPLLFAKLQEGEIVLDLGSGGGIDALAAAKYVGLSGKVYGLDMTESMLTLANKNKEEMGVANVEFLQGYLEEIPLPDQSVDVVMSNCVINLSEDKEKALEEAYRVLKAGGRLAIADMVSLKVLPAEIRKQTELWCGCLAGTLAVDSYRQILAQAGFVNLEIEPVSVFTKPVIKELYREQLHQMPGLDLDQVDGAFASALIKADKAR